MNGGPTRAWARLSHPTELSPRDLRLSLGLVADWAADFVARHAIELLRQHFDLARLSFVIPTQLRSKQLRVIYFRVSVFHAD